MGIKISTGKVKSAYRGGQIPLQGTWLTPAGDIVHPRREGGKGLTLGDIGVQGELAGGQEARKMVK